MNVGRMNRRIRIDAQSVGQDADGYGTRANAWGPLCEVWAEFVEVLPSSGIEEKAHTAIAAATAFVRMRKPPQFIQIAPDMRVVQLDRGNREWRVMSQPVEVGGGAGIEFSVEAYTTPGGAA